MPEEAATGAAAGNAPARVRYGVHNQQGDIAGKTIGQIRAERGRQWQLPGDTAAYKGTEKLSDDYVIRPGDNVEFHRRQGEKG